MFIKKPTFQKRIRSLQSFEYNWTKYKKHFPNQTWGFRYRIIVESYIYRDKKEVFKSIIDIPLTNYLYVSKRNYRKLKQYVKINRLLRTSLKKNLPQKVHPDKTYQTDP